MKRIVGAVASLLMGLGLVLAAAGPSAAVGTGFEPDPGRKCGTAPKPYWKWSSVTKKYVLTHHAVVENYTSKAGSRTKTMAVSATVTAAVTFTTSAKVSASLPIGGLEGQTSLSLQASGARTTSSTVSETYTVQPGTSVFYQGTRQASGSFTYYKPACLQGSWIWTKVPGKVTSWTSEISGALWCKTTPPANTLAAVAKKKCTG
ncbi:MULTISPECIES: hypothetical protein [unclassified Cellulomonas]|uniref:hypothetical protein n=1 Tax=unclassified Cellulomonas TaxID=2620175 RepID=UPI000A720A90|nr:MULTISPECIES: hypothetical protein [unclassified Cellulomonas]MCR6703503.1 hypothetical protein [Cellulomonas sp.]